MRAARQTNPATVQHSPTHGPIIQETKADKNQFQFLAPKPGRAPQQTYLRPRHRAFIPNSDAPSCGNLRIRPLLSDRGSPRALASPGRPPHPQQKIFLRRKNEIYQRGRKLEADFRYTNFFGPLPPPPPPGGSVSATRSNRLLGIRAAHGCSGACQGSQLCASCYSHTNSPFSLPACPQWYMLLVSRGHSGASRDARATVLKLMISGLKMAFWEPGH